MIDTQMEPLASTIYDQQIDNLFACVQRMHSQVMIYPIHDMNGFSKVKSEFMYIREEADIYCRILDRTASIDKSSLALDAILSLIVQLVDLKNDAYDLVENRTNEYFQ